MKKYHKIERRNRNWSQKNSNFFLIPRKKLQSRKIVFSPFRWYSSIKRSINCKIPDGIRTQQNAHRYYYMLEWPEMCVWQFMQKTMLCEFVPLLLLNAKQQAVVVVNMEYEFLFHQMSISLDGISAFNAIWMSVGHQMRFYFFSSFLLPKL